ncbi:MAG: VOC family protein [Paracoccaceae bacterium]
MKLTLHHVNLATENVERMDDFYRQVLGLNRETQGLPKLEKNKGYAGDVAFVTDGAIQMHLAQKDVLAGIRAGQTVNPVSHGHIAYRTDDLPAFIAHLEEQGGPLPNGAIRRSQAGVRFSFMTLMETSSKSIKSKAKLPPD